MVVGLVAAGQRPVGALERIAIEVLEPPERTWVVREFPGNVGILFVDGELSAVPGGRLINGNGKPVPFEAEATGWWDPQRTRVKWLLLRFTASTDREYFFEIGGTPTRPPGPSLAIEEAGCVVVSTGPLQVRFDANTPGLFSDVKLNGRPVLAPSTETLPLVADDGKAQTPGRLTDWNVALEEATPARASVKATGQYRFPDGKPMARLDLRYEFFRGESFVRVYHTLTWMVRDPVVGIRDLAVRLKPTTGQNGRARVGLSDYTDDACETGLRPGSETLAFQDQGDHFLIRSNGRAASEGKTLGGWIDVADAAGRGVTVALRHAWQTFPTAFRIRDGGVSVQFWPTEGERLSFMPEGIMPSDFYNAERVWRRFWWSRDAGHYTNEYARRRTGKGGTIPNKYFVYTAEGAARTHELAIFFHDESSKRTPAQINSVTQHPVILRQDPSSAMRVPFMGFRLMPVQRDKYPNIERAVDLLGRMSMARRVPQHNFGLLRFGMILWGRPLHPNNSLYRWMDNLQYDQQLVPWLLFLRGGDRRLYEDGEITARYAMDVNVNHYNTRGYPPGNCATCGGGLPFPFIEMCIWNQKGVKIHYLSYYYHLTGYRRAKEVMDEVIAGQKEFTLKVSDTPEERHSTAREIYNMNVFWVNAYEETFDPEIGKLCRESMRITAEREYNRELNAHRHPQVYLYNGLVLQHRQWQDEALRETMLRDLSADLLPIVGEGGIHSVTDLIGCGWAYEQTGNKGYATAGWDVARALADLTPDADFASGIPLDGCINGSGLYRGFLLPILVGASLGDRLGLTTEQPTHLTGTFFFLSPEAPRSRDVKLTAYVRPRRRGDLKLSIHCRTAPAAPVEVQALDPTGREVLSTALEAPEVRPSERFYPRNRLSADREVTLPDAHQGAVYRLEFHGKGRPLLRVAGDADIVYRFPDTPQHACAPLSGGQRYTGYQLVTRTTKDVVTFETTDNIFHRPHVIRDAKTGELLHRYALSDPLKRQHRLGKGRMIRILLAGARGNRAWSIDGVSPYFSSTLNEWFDPDED